MKKIEISGKNGKKRPLTYNTSLVYKLRTGPVIPGFSHSSAVSRDLGSQGQTAFINVLC